MLRVRRKLRDYPLEKLREALQHLDKGGRPSEVHAKTGIPRSTLRDYKVLLENSGMKAEELQIPKLGHPTKLSDIAEKRLHDFFVECQLANCPLTHQEAQHVVLAVLQAEGNLHFFDTKDGLPGRDWFEGFFKRWPDLNERIANRLSAAALRAEDPALITEALNKFKERKGDIKDERCFTQDEFMLKGSKKPTGGVKVVALRGRKSVRAMASASGGGHITAINCIDGSGNKPLKTAVLQKGVENFRVQPLGEHCVTMGRTSTDLPSSQQRSLCRVVDKGWQTGRSLLFWVKWFASEVKPTAEDPVMLVMDQHSSRFNLLVMEYCRDHHIRLFVLPPNLTHLLSVGILHACLSWCLCFRIPRS